MPLIQLWDKTPDIILRYNIKQIVSSAGDGVLKNGNECSKELRHFLSNALAEKLFEDADLARYRNQLIESRRITKNSSILIVVGRNDTSDLEAQIRGSRHAWEGNNVSNGC